MVLHDFKYGSLESLLNNLGEKTVRSGQCTYLGRVKVGLKWTFLPLSARLRIIIAFMLNLRKEDHFSISHLPVHFHLDSLLARFQRV